MEIPMRVRNILWDAWARLARMLPGGRGRSFSAHLLRRVVGLPVRVVSGVKLELFPVSSADEWTAIYLQGGTAVHEAMDRFLRPGMVFVDVGANIGLFSILATKVYGARVIAVEPSSRERLRLERNLAINGVSCTILPFALGNLVGNVSFELDKGGAHTMNRIRSGGSTDANSVVAVRRFDSELSDLDPLSVGLVKIDVEGYEMAVLQGMTSMIDRMAAAVFVIEVTPAWLQENGSSADELYSFFESRGWRSTRGRGSGFQWDEIFVPVAFFGRDKSFAAH